MRQRAGSNIIGMRQPVPEFDLNSELSAYYGDPSAVNFHRESDLPQKQEPARVLHIADSYNVAVLGAIRIMDEHDYIAHNFGVTEEHASQIYDALLKRLGAAAPLGFQNLTKPEVSFQVERIVEEEFRRQAPSVQRRVTYTCH